MLKLRTRLMGIKAIVVVTRNTPLVSQFVISFRRVFFDSQGVLCAVKIYR